MQGGGSNTMKAIAIEVLGAVIVLLLLVVFRPMLIGSVATAGQAYTYHYTNSTGGDATATITPVASLTTAQADQIFSLILAVVVIAALVVIVLTAVGKIKF